MPKMTSRERVLAAFNYVEGDRVPVWFGSSPEFLRKAKQQLGIEDTENLFVRLGDDFRRVYEEYSGPVSPRDLFGKMERRGAYIGQAQNHPLADATLAQVHEYPWPDPSWIDVSKIRMGASKYNRQYAILGGSWSPFWHVALDLMGMENLMVKMYDEPDLVDAVMGYIADFYTGVNQRIFEAGSDVIDIFFIGNDFGSQSGPLIGENLFRRFVLPHLKRLIDIGHNYGLKVMMHCCGGITPLIPAMIEVGLDGLQALQPSIRGMEPDTLKATFGDKIVLNGCIDSHHVLINGTPDLVRTKTRETIDIMKPGGGYILSASHDYILEETPVENILAMFDTAREYGYYH